MIGRVELFMVIAIGLGTERSFYIDAELLQSLFYFIRGSLVKHEVVITESKNIIWEKRMKIKDDDNSLAFAYFLIGIMLINPKMSLCSADNWSSSKLFSWVRPQEESERAGKEV